MKKRAVLILVLIVSILVNGVYALSGSGTLADPYQIYNCIDLNDVRNNLTAAYKLMNNIDCNISPYNNETGFYPIGSVTAPFNGNFDGNGKVIQNLKMNFTFLSTNISHHLGLFGSIETAKISKLGLENVWIRNNLTGGPNRYTGSLVGHVLTDGSLQISQVYSTGYLESINNILGGLIGRMELGEINDSYSNATTNRTANSHSAGLIGSTDGALSVNRCYATGLVIAPNTKNGLLGDSPAGSVTSSYYDNQTTNTTVSAGGGVGKTTLEMKNQSTYTGWDFTNVWHIDEGVNYPILRIFGGAASCGENITQSTTLTQNLTCSGNALKITGNNIIVDCAGYSIIGNGTGIAIQAEDVNNVTIRNCNINSFNISIAFLNSTDGQIYNITSKNASSMGIEIDANSANNNIQNATIDQNNERGFVAALLLEGSNNSLRNVSAETELGFGIGLSGSNNTIINSTFGSVDSYGILMNGTASQNTIHDTYCISVNSYALMMKDLSINNTFVNINCQGTEGVSMETQASKNSIYNSIINTSNLAVQIYSNQSLIKDSNITSINYALVAVGSDLIFERNIMTAEIVNAVYDADTNTNLTFINNTIFSEVSEAILTYSNNSLFIGNNITSTASDAIVSNGYHTIFDSNKINSTTANGLYFSSGGNLTITNNIVNSNLDGLDLNFGIDGNIIIGNNCSAGGSALDIGSNNNIVLNNKGYSIAGYGIEVRGNYNNVSNNFGFSNFVGLFVEGSNNYFYNNTGHSNDSYGLTIQNSYNNLFINNTGIVDYNATLLYPPVALGLAVGVGNNTFINTLARASNARALWLSEVFGDTQNNTFINITLESNYTWIVSDSTSINNSFDGLTFKSSTGSITILENLTLPNSVNVTINELKIGQNYTFLNSTNLTFLNKSAEITLNGINYSNPQIVADYNDNGTFVNCNSPLCNITSYTGGVLVFRVAHFTNYTVQEANSTQCGSVNQSLTLTQSINSTGTCLNIDADNILVDCQGFEIIYATTETGYGINATGRNNITIQNCNITQDPSNQTDSHGIVLNQTSKGFIYNITATSTDGKGFLAIDSNELFFENITAQSINGISIHGRSVNNTIFTGIISNSSTAQAFQFEDSFNITVNNAVATTDSASAFSIENTNLLNLSFVNSTAFTSGQGIRLFQTQDVTLTDSNGTSILDEGIIFDSGSNFAASNIIGTSTNGIGIYILNSSNCSLLNSAGISDISGGIILFIGTGNIVNNSNGTSNAGTAIAILEQNTSFIYNNIGITDSGTGFELRDSINLTVINNTGQDTNGGGGFGLVTLTHSRLHLNSGYGNVIGFFASDSSNNNLTNTTGIGGEFGIAFVAGSNNNILINSSAYIDGSISSNPFGPDALGIIGFIAPVQNNTFINTKIGSNGANALGFEIDAVNNTLINTIIETNKTWIYSDSTSFDNTIQNTTFATPNTNVTYSQTLTVPADVNASIDNFNISFNKVFLNSTNISILNQTARIVFANLLTAHDIPLIDEDDSGNFTQCPPLVCQNITTGTTFSMDVTGFTSYSSTAGGVAITLEKTDNTDPLDITNTNTLIYQINFSVTSGTAYNVTINETYPSNTTFISATPAPTSGNNSWNAGNITSGSSYQINITLSVSNSLPNGTILTNTVNATYENSTGSLFSAGVEENTTIIVSPVLQSSSSGGGGGGSSSAICPPFCRYPENKNLPVCRNNCVEEIPTQISYPLFPATNKAKQEKTEIEQAIEEKVEEAENKKTEEIRQEIPQSKYKLPDNLIYYVFFLMAGLGVLILLVIGLKYNRKEANRKEKR